MLVCETGSITIVCWVAALQACVVLTCNWLATTIFYSCIALCMTVNYLTHCVKQSSRVLLAWGRVGMEERGRRGQQDSIRVYAVVSTPDAQWVANTGLAGKTAAEVKTSLLGNDSLFGKWAVPLQDLLATACHEEPKANSGSVADIKPMFQWSHGTGLTLLGDAAHLMRPWAGEGVNSAFGTRWTYHESSLPFLAPRMPPWQTALAPRIRDLEISMCARAKEKAEEIASNKTVS